MSVNKEHLLRIKQHILEKPSRLYMADWIKILHPGTVVVDEYNKQSIQQTVPQCGTVCCIAGWSAVLRGLDEVDIKEEHVFLGVQMELFFVNHWPAKLNNRYKEATTVLEKAKVAADAIDLIIEGNGYFPVGEYGEDDE